MELKKVFTVKFNTTKKRYVISTEKKTAIQIANLLLAGKHIYTTKSQAKSLCDYLNKNLKK